VGVLLRNRNEQGHWTGKLSPSALSTATAAAALHMTDPAAHESMVAQGLDWLVEHVNDDGGWGDTPLSRSNIATTLIAVSCLAICDTGQSPHQQAAEAGRKWISVTCGALTPDAIAEALARRYGDDRTFSAPILAMCALAGLLGPGPEAWDHVAQLPFEVAVLPHRLLRWIRLPVVSYALPALIAIGQLRHRGKPTRNPIARLVRNRLQGATLRKLSRVQPESGGFLEAAPLTSFVTMSLCHMGLGDHPVAREAAGFLKATRSDDGSWPIDTNLATWVTTRSIEALRACGRLQTALPVDQRAAIRRWLLDQQHRRAHPYTQAPPGGWAWTDLSGGVPDADDTAGALLALRALEPAGSETVTAAVEGCRWLRGIQNSDKGIPTFCRGWGRLDFDRSSSDLTAHAIRAWRSWRGELPARLAASVTSAAQRGVRKFLPAVQRGDGAWSALWFGNELARGEENPVFGTSRVVLALAEEESDQAVTCAKRGVDYLLHAQRESGGWGPAAPAEAREAPESIEETACAVEALAAAWNSPHAGLDRDVIARGAVRGCQRLAEMTENGTFFPPAPIGLYFARLWYYEQMYPIVMALAAWGRARALLAANGAD
jgi:squalene-hopene/tetraprenyl-beta-curcumene cyclase